MTPEQVLNRKRIVEMSYEAKTAHLGSALSVVDIIEAIYSVKGQGDEFVLSNGHAAVAFYAVLERYGLLSNPKIDELGVHPDRNPDIGIEVSTGSLGQGLPIAVGMAVADRAKNIYCCVSDGECAEGSVWEALRIAQEQQLDNLKIIVNANGFDASDPVDLETLLSRLQAQGCAVLIADGHNLEELTEALSLRIKNVPLVIFAKTSVEQLPMLSGLAAHYKILSEGELKDSLVYLDRQNEGETAIREDTLSFREKAVRVEIPQVKIEQLNRLCQTFAEGADHFILPGRDHRALEVTRTGESAWAIRQLTTVYGYEDCSADYFSVFYLDEESLRVIHLKLKDYLEKRGDYWWWGNQKPNASEIECQLLSGGLPFVLEKVKSNGGGPDISLSPEHLITFLQESLVAKEAARSGAKISFDGYDLREHINVFRNTIRYFIETCKKHPGEMSGLMMTLGDTFWQFGQDSSLAVGLTAAGENGLRLKNGSPIPRLRETTEPMRFQDEFSLVAKRLYCQSQGKYDWLSPEYFLAFRNEDMRERVRSYGIRVQPSTKTLQLRKLGQYLIKEGNPEIRALASPDPLKVTYYDGNEEVMIGGVFVTFFGDTFEAKNDFVCLIEPDGSAIISGLHRFVSGEGLVNWLIEMAQDNLVENLASADGELLFDFRSRDVQMTRNSIRYFIRACRNNPELMSGAEIRIGVGGKVDFFASDLGEAILIALEEIGLIDFQARLKTNSMISRVFGTRTIQLGNQFKLNVVHDLSEYDVSYVLSFRERQIK